MTQFVYVAKVMTKDGGDFIIGYYDSFDTAEEQIRALYKNEIVFKELETKWEKDRVNQWFIIRLKSDDDPKNDVNVLVTRKVIQTKLTEV